MHCTIQTSQARRISLVLNFAINCTNSFSSEMQQTVQFIIVSPRTFVFEGAGILEGHSSTPSPHSTPAMFAQRNLCAFYCQTCNNWHINTDRAWPPTHTMVFVTLGRWRGVTLIVRSVVFQQQCMRHGTRGLAKKWLVVFGALCG